MEKKKIITSLAYKFSERLSVKALGLVISIVLARLIAPEDFGQLALITVFINLSQTIIQGGLNTALVQSKNADDDDYSTVFYISAIIALIATVCLYITAPFISHYYGSDSLVWPLRVYAFVLLFGAFNSVQVAKLQREMNFKATMYSSLIATVLSGLLGIAMAYLGMGIWALVIYNASYIVFSCITMLFASKWIPRFVFSCTRAKELFSYGWKMLFSAILCSLYQDIRTLIIGKKFSTNDLAYYDRGQQFPIIISSTVVAAIQSVMFPVLASQQDNITAVKHTLRKTISLSALFVIPLMTGLACTSENVVRLLLTEKWLPCVFYMQIVCLADVFYPISSSNLVAIKAIGRSDVYMKLEIVRRIIMIIILAVSVLAFNSIEAIVIGYLISSIIDYIVIMIPIKKLLNYGVFAQIKDTWKMFFAAACMAVFVYLVSLTTLPVLVELLLQVLVGVASYAILCYLLKIESFMNLKDNIFKKSNT